jgi:hypothetical protein
MNPAALTRELAAAVDAPVLDDPKDLLNRGKKVA